MIISASRRTDIPAFYASWFVDRLKKGEICTRNPVNHRQVTRYLFSPETIDAIVFWTKDPENLMPYLDEIDWMGYRYYFQFTLTPYGKELEKNLRDKGEIVRTFQRLSTRIGKERVVWRYDPIIYNDSMGLVYHVDHFTELCEQLAGYTDTCVLSFVDLYYKNEAAVKAGLLRTISPEEMEETCLAFSQIAKLYHLRLETCCEGMDFSSHGVYPASCIDKDRLEKVCGYPLDLRPDSGQREFCHCYRSVDVGTYNTCPHGCVYCYASYSAKLIQEHCSNQSMDSPILAGGLPAEGQIITKQAVSNRLPTDQLSLFSL